MATKNTATKKEPKSGYISLRATPEMYEAFKKESKKYGGTSEVLRELISAFLDGRMTIKRDPKKHDLFSIGK